MSIDRISERKLLATIWSWNQEEPLIKNGCAFLDETFRWKTKNCLYSSYSYACKLPGDKSVWKTTETKGPWNLGKETCQNEFPGSEFVLPSNGWENQQIPNNSEGIWINFRPKHFKNFPYR